MEINKNDHISLTLYQGINRKFSGCMSNLQILCCGKVCNSHKDGQDGLVDSIKIIPQNQKILHQEGSLVIYSYNLLMEMKTLSQRYLLYEGKKTHPQSKEILNIKRYRQDCFRFIIIYMRESNFYVLIV